MPPSISEFSEQLSQFSVMKWEAVASRGI